MPRNDCRARPPPHTAPACSLALVTSLARILELGTRNAVRRAPCKWRLPCGVRAGKDSASCERRRRAGRRGGAPSPFFERGRQGEALLGGAALSRAELPSFPEGLPAEAWPPRAWPCSAVLCQALANAVAAAVWGQVDGSGACSAWRGDLTAGGICSLEHADVDTAGGKWQGGVGWGMARHGTATPLTSSRPSKTNEVLPVYAMGVRCCEATGVQQESKQEQAPCT